MRQPYSPCVAARGSLGDDGYTFLPRLLSRRKVRKLRQPIQHLRATRAVGACERPNNTLIPLRWNDKSVVAVLRDATSMQRVRTASGGSDLRWISGYVS